MILKSVGTNGFNNHNDVLIVQCALNVLRSSRQLSLIVIDGIIGPETINAIFQFQRTNIGLITDGRIDPGGATLARLTAQIGGEVFVFGPVVHQLLGLKAEFDRIGLVLPVTAKRPFNRVQQGLNALVPHKDLAVTFGAGPPTNVTGFNSGPQRFGLAGVDDAAAAAALAAMALIIFVFLVALIQSPAFQKDVAVRAKELDRILKDLRINASIGVKESLDLIISIVGDPQTEINRCRQSPTFQNSIECSLALQEFARIAAKIRNIIPKLELLVQILTTNRESGRDFQKIRINFNRLLKEIQQDTADLQVSLANLKDKCNCPDV